MWLFAIYFSFLSFSFFPQKNGEWTKDLVAKMIKNPFFSCFKFLNEYFFFVVGGNVCEEIIFYRPFDLGPSFWNYNVLKRK